VGCRLHGMWPSGDPLLERLHVGTVEIADSLRGIELAATKNRPRGFERWLKKEEYRQRNYWRTMGKKLTAEVWALSNSGWRLVEIHGLSGRLEPTSCGGVRSWKWIGLVAGGDNNCQVRRRAGCVSQAIVQGSATG
jgi:hypothetical protein